MADLRTLRDLLYRMNVIPADDLDVYALRIEVLQDPRCFFADRIAQDDQGDQRAVHRLQIFGDRPIAVSQHDDPLAADGLLLDPALNGRIFLRKQKVIGTDQIRSLLSIGDGAGLAHAGKRQRIHTIPVALRRHIVAQGLCGRIVVFQIMEEMRQDRLHVSIADRQDPLHLHRSLRQRSGLVKADRIHPRQRLDAIQLLHQRLVAGQVDRSHGPAPRW